jgi:type IV secretion system protein VirB8
MFNKKSSKAVDATVSQSVNFELTLAQMARRSERRAWWVTCAAIILTLMLAGGYYYMLPLKQKVPYLVMADAATGVATVARLTDEVNIQRITSSDAINRSNVANFVRARESYDAAFLNLHDWPTVMTMATSGVAVAYRQLFSTQNPDNPYQTYGRDRSIRIKILSISFTGSNTTAVNKVKTATVRFQRTVYNKQNGGTAPLDNKIAMMEFTYKPDLNMDEQTRLQNPLGFQVTGYRVDNDFSSPAPAEVPLAAPPAAPPVEAPPPPPAPVASVAPVAAEPEPPPAPAPRKPRRTRKVRTGASNP